MNTTKRTFLRHRTLEELRIAVTKEGWALADVLFKKGSDGVSFKFQVGKTKGLCVFNTVNGTFLGQLDSGEMFSSQTSSHDNCRWFQKLLTVCLVEGQATNAKAFGYDVEIEVWAGPASTKTIWKHWRVKTISAAKQRGMLIANAKGVLQCLPLTEKEWITAYGDPRMKAES